MTPETFRRHTRKAHPKCSYCARARRFIDETRAQTARAEYERQKAERRTQRLNEFVSSRLEPFVNSHDGVERVLREDRNRLANELEATPTTLGDAPLLQKLSLAQKQRDDVARINLAVLHWHNKAHGQPCSYPCCPVREALGGDLRE